MAVAVCPVPSPDCEAADLNNQGEVVGSHLGRAFKWSDSSGMLDLGVLDGGSSAALSLNDAGQVVGLASTLEDDGFGHDITRGFVWNAATGMTGLDPAPGYYFAMATAIDEGGTVAGTSKGLSAGSSSPGMEDHATKWPASGGVVDLGALPGGTSSFVDDITADGRVVGSSDEGTVDSQGYVIYRPVTWTAAGVLEPLAMLPGHVHGNALGSNGAGVIVGETAQYYGPRPRHLPDVSPGRRGERRGVAWWDGQTPTSLGTLPGGRESTARDVNASDEIVGTCDAHGGGRDLNVACLWRSGRWVALDDLVDGLEGWTLTVGLAINDAGQILAQGIHADGTVTHFLLSPVP